MGDRENRDQGDLVDVERMFYNIACLLEPAPY